MPLQATSGAASYDAFGGGVVAEPNYIESVFSTYLYTSDGTTQTITNGIDLSTKGGLVWIKNRSAAQNHYLSTTTLGIQNTLTSNNTGALGIGSDIVHSVTTTGFTAPYNFNIGENLVSWTFREQPKFFDVVTYTGTGSNTTIAHNLGSVPGCIIVKCTSSGDDWQVYHQSLANTQYLNLGSTAQATTSTTLWNSTTPTSTVFSLGTSTGANRNGSTYVAYLFAHDAGGFGLTGTDNVISCGTFTGNTTVTLGYEPQWILVKKSSGVGDWYLQDNMRGWPVSGDAAYLLANSSAAEGQTSQIYPNATGFSTLIGSGDYIYIACRRGPMKVPTLGTSVFSPIAYPGLVPGAGNSTKTTGFPVDLILARLRNFTVNFGPSGSTTGMLPRLTGGLTSSGTTVTTPIMATLSTDAETTQNTGIFASNNTGFVITGNTGALAVDTVGQTYIAECFGRAPGFFDVVCYTGTGTSNSQSHNLTVAPELVLIKRRDTAANWVTLYDFSASTYSYFLPGVNGTGAGTTGNAYGSGGFLGSQPTLTQLPITSSDSQTNASAGTYVAYLFASAPGVSKVGSYTGNGTTQTINCGFTGGARFVLIKRTDAAGDWYVWDSARGIVAGNDPHLSLNTTAAEVTTDDSVDTDNTGFIVNQVAATNVNVSSATYIGLAIA